MIASYPAYKSPDPDEQKLRNFVVELHEKNGRAWMEYVCHQLVARKDEQTGKIKREPCGCRFLSLNDAKEHVGAHELGWV